MISASFTSDQHVNSDTGLLAPNIKLDSGRTIQHNEYQAVLWKYWLDYCAKFAAYPGDKMVVINGDLFDLDELGGQRISDNPADIMKMGTATFEPLLDIANTYRFVIRGTDKHGGKLNFLEEMFATNIGAQRCPETGNYAWWELRQNIGGINVHTAHHINIGQKPWSELNPIFAKIYEIMLGEIAQGYVVPDLIFRGHVHTSVDTEGVNKFSRLIVTPSWQGKNSYAHKKVQAKPTLHGGTFVTFDKGHYELRNIIYEPRKATVWTL